ncbi:hypothetical protein DVH24_010076 [Malus domestica]|uniref:Uncharacterized protein n=1 Tax=Malus domestica TaxID=3750 RepID=A0A498JX26_MALDO|nr:hypothetical protein DVH24_010076 [Malus domestica]
MKSIVSMALPKNEPASEVKKFLTTRKVMKKVIWKILGYLKGVSPLNKQNEAEATYSDHVKIHVHFYLGSKDTIKAKWMVSCMIVSNLTHYAKRSGKQRRK